jgi:hypothetical protein
MKTHGRIDVEGHYLEVSSQLIGQIALPPGKQASLPTGKKAGTAPQSVATTSE